MLVFFIPTCTAPSSPINLTLHVESNTTIKLSWLRPKYENGIIRLYNIHVIGSGINSIEWFINVTGDENSTSVESLNPYTNYTFRVRARTNAGWGNFSESVTALTHEGRKCIHIL